MTEVELWREVYRTALVDSSGDEKNAKKLVDRFYEERVLTFTDAEG